MLVLTRRSGERIMIGDNIAVVVVSNRHGRVRLGIEAPRGMAIARKEVYEELTSTTDIASHERQRPFSCGLRKSHCRT